MRYLFQGSPYVRGCSILGSILGSPRSGKLALPYKIGLLDFGTANQQSLCAGTAAASATSGSALRVP